MDNGPGDIQLLESSAYANTFGAVVARDPYNLAPHTSPPTELAYHPRRSLAYDPLQEQWLVPSIVHPPIHMPFKMQQQPNYVACGGKSNFSTACTLPLDCGRTTGLQNWSEPLLLPDGPCRSINLRGASFPINTEPGVFTSAPGRETVDAAGATDTLSQYDGLSISGRSQQYLEYLVHTASGPDCQRGPSSRLMTTPSYHSEEARRDNELVTSSQSPELVSETKKSGDASSPSGMYYCLDPVCDKRFRRKEHLVRHGHM